MNKEYNKVYYFVYCGVAYGVGTKVKLKEHVHTKTYNTTITKNDIYVFQFGCVDGIRMFCWADETRRPNWHKGLIYIRNCDEDIEEIIEPVYPNFVSWQEKAIDNMVNKTVVADVFGGVLMYIIAMLVGAIFKDRFLIWTIGTVIFGLWLLYQYRT